MVTLDPRTGVATVKRYAIEMRSVGVKGRQAFNEVLKHCCSSKPNCLNASSCIGYIIPICLCRREVCFDGYFTIAAGLRVKSTEIVVMNPKLSSRRLSVLVNEPDRI